MKCENCPANRRTSYEYGEYECAAGVPEDGKMTTDCGCKYSRKVIEKRMNRLDDLEASQYDGIDVFYCTEEELTKAMHEALKETMADKCNSEICLAKKWDDGTLHELKEDEWRDWEFPSWLRSNYEDEEEKVQLNWCKKCRWKGRHQKCSCCRRNRSMRDLFKEKENEEHC